MQTITLTRVYRTNKDKAGNTLVFSSGKSAGQPYTRVSIQCQEYGERWLSGFEGAWNKDWKEGDKVSVEIEQKGDFLNFYRVDVAKALEGTVALMEARIKRLEAKVFPLAEPTSPVGDWDELL